RLDLFEVGRGRAAQPGAGYRVRHRQCRCRAARQPADAIVAQRARPLTAIERVSHRAAGTRVDNGDGRELEAYGHGLHFARRIASVRATISGGALAAAAISFCNSSPLPGWNSCPDRSISLRNSGSLIVASKARRRMLTRSGGMPGGARIERPISSLLV